MNARSALNAAILAAHAAGLRPFKCFGCGDYFTEDRRDKKGRLRIVCDDPICKQARIYWTRYGRWPTSDPATIHRWKDDGHRRPVRMIFEVAA